jgi:hypothetical protein
VPLLRSLKFWPARLIRVPNVVDIFSAVAQSLNFVATLDDSQIILCLLSTFAAIPPTAAFLVARDVLQFALKKPTSEALTFLSRLAMSIESAFRIDGLCGLRLAFNVLSWLRACGRLSTPQS